MILSRFLRNNEGAAAVEFSMTAPLFFLVIFAMVEFCLVLYSQFALQHGVEMAARCAALKTCATTVDVQNFAAAQSYGLSPPSGTFSVTTVSCGSQVAAAYTYSFVSSYWSPTLTINAQSCFPTQS